MTGRPLPDEFDGTLDVLAEVVGRERRVDPETATRIGREASMVAAVGAATTGVVDTVSLIASDDPEQAEDTDTSELTAVVSRPMPRRDRRRWYPAAAAAAVAVLAAAGYSLSGPSGEPTSTDGAVVRTEPTVPTTEPAPVSSTAATVTTDDASATTSSGNVDEPSSGATTDPAPTVVERSTTTDTMATTAPTATTPPSSTSSTSSSSSPPSSATSVASPASLLVDEGVAVTVGNAGAVALRINDATATVVDVAVNPGWSHVINAGSDGGVTVRFTGNGDVARLVVQFTEIAATSGDDDDEEDDDDERGTPSRGFRLTVETNASYQAIGATDRRFDFGPAGTVRIGYNSEGLSSMEVVPGNSRSTIVNTPTPGVLDVRLSGSDDDSSAVQTLTIGPLTVEIRVVS